MGRNQKFHPQSSLKPFWLEREASFVEVRHFCECLNKDLSKKSDLWANQLEVTDPKVLEIGLAGAEDLNFIRIMIYIENRTPLKDIPADCELAAIGSVMKNLAVKVLCNGTRLVL